MRRMRKGKQQLGTLAKRASGGVAEKRRRLLHHWCREVVSGGVSFGACAVPQADGGNRGAEREEKSVPQARHLSPVVFV